MATPILPHTPDPSQQSSVNLSPETRKLLAELYGAWFVYAISRPYHISFLEWLEYTAGNLWLEAGRPQDEAHDANGRGAV